MAGCLTWQHQKGCNRLLAARRCRLIDERLRAVPRFGEGVRRHGQVVFNVVRLALKGCSGDIYYTITQIHCIFTTNVVSLVTPLEYYTDHLLSLMDKTLMFEHPHEKGIPEKSPLCQVLKSKHRGSSCCHDPRIGKFEWPGAGNGETTVALSETGGNLGSITAGAANKDGFETKLRPEESTNVMFRIQSDPSAAHPSPARTCDHDGQSGISPLSAAQNQETAPGPRCKDTCFVICFPFLCPVVTLSSSSKT